MAKAVTRRPAELVETPRLRATAGSTPPITKASGCLDIRVMRARLRPLSGGLCRGHAQLGQQAAVVGLHPFLGQPALVVVHEGTDHFPLEVLTGGLDWTDGRVGKDPREVTGERGARRQGGAVRDDLLTDEPQASESGAQGREVRAQLIEAQVGAGPVEDVVGSEVN